MGSSPIVSLRVADLRTLLYDSALKGIEEGAALEMVDGLRSYHVNERSRFHADGLAARRTRHEQAITAARASADRARENANEVTDVDADTRKAFLADAVRATQLVKRLTTELEALRVEETQGRSGPFSCDGDYIARGLANLLHLPGLVTAEMNNAIKLIVSDLRITAHTSRHISFEWWLRFPVPGGVARLGPLTFSMAHDTPLFRRLQSQQVRFLDAVDAAAGGPGGNARLEKYAALARMRRTLVDHGFNAAAAQSASICPIPELVDVLIAHVTGSPYEGDAGYAAHILDIYQDPDFTWVRTYAQSCTTRQLILDAIVAGGGRATPRTVAAAVGRTRSTIAALTRIQLSRGRGIPATVPNDTTRTWPIDEPLLLVECMHCGAGADFAVSTPETPDLLLCTHCMRMPRVGSSPVFPSGYLLLRDAPRIGEEAAEP